MSEGKLRVTSGGVLNSEAVFDSRSDELLVLIAIMDAPNRYSTAEEISEVTRVPVHRVTAAIAMFTSAGILSREGDVSYEFEVRGNERGFVERDSAEVAKSIRDNELHELFSELGQLMKKERFTNTDENKMINSLVTDLGLDTEYILMLAAYIKSKGALTVYKLRNKADELAEKDIDTVEKLEGYIKTMENDFSLEWEFRNTFKLYKRAPFKYELDLYRKWTEVYGFTFEIIRHAIDVNLRAHAEYSYPYLDTLLTEWHESECKTLADCKAASEKTSLKLKEQHAPRAKRSEAPKPTYGDFDANAAFERAIAKSFAATNDDNE